MENQQNRAQIIIIIPHGAFHANPIPDIFPRILLLRHRVTGEISKWHGPDIRIYACNVETQRIKNLKKLTKLRNGGARAKLIEYFCKLRPSDCWKV